jgi:hypothetical protein
VLRAVDYFCSHDDYFWERWLLELLVRILLVLVYLGSQALRQNYNSTSSTPATPPQGAKRTCCRPSCAILASPRAISILLAFSPMAVTATLHCIGRGVPVGWPRASPSPCAGTAACRSLRARPRGSGRRWQQRGRWLRGEGGTESYGERVVGVEEGGERAPAYLHCELHHGRVLHQSFLNK